MQIKGRHLANLLRVGFALLFVVVCGEIFLRLLKPQVFDVHPQGMYVEDAAIGYVLKPGFEGVIERSEFRVPFTIDGSGLRGKGPRPRKENSFRILVLGDSQAFGFGVRDDETFSAQLEEILVARFKNLNVQVLNAGVPGSGTADQLAFLKSRGAELAPDLVIVQFLSVNDIAESQSPAAEWAAVEDGWLIDRHNRDEEATEETGGDDSPNLAERLRQIKRNSHLFHLASNSAGYLAIRLGLLDWIGALWGEDFAADEGAKTSDILVQIAEEGRRLGAASLFVYGTAKNFVLSADYTLPRSGQVVREAAASAEVPWVDSTPILRGRPDRTELYFKLDGHWSSQGHRTIAELLADQVIDMGLVDAAGSE
jgi:lysophospholipase L1-like esterase